MRYFVLTCHGRDRAHFWLRSNVKLRRGCHASGHLVQRSRWIKTSSALDDVGRLTRKICYQALEDKLLARVPHLIHSIFLHVCSVPNVSCEFGHTNKWVPMWLLDFGGSPRMTVHLVAAISSRVLNLIQWFVLQFCFVPLKSIFTLRFCAWSSNTSTLMLCCA